MLYLYGQHLLNNDLVLGILLSLKSLLTDFIKGPYLRS